MKQYSPYLFFLVSLVFVPGLIIAQIGGDRVYEFINLPASSRITGTGGNLITTMDDDVSLAFHNPALLNPSMHNRFSVGSVIYFSGINFGNFNYVRDYSDIATFQVGIQYITYGQFDQTNVHGDKEGKFSASEYVINTGGGRQYEKYSYGGNLKWIISQLESNNSIGVALDLAAAYNDTAKLFTATLLIKNIGGQLSSYSGNRREPIPFEIQAGFSKRFKHLPFRIGVIVHNLQKFNIRYDDDSQVQTQNLFSSDSSSSGNSARDIFDNIARHFIINGELFLGKALRIGFGYNHQRRQEMKVSTKKGVTGFSFGVGIKIKQFEFGFARGRYHLAGASNHFSVAVNLNELVKRKVVN